MIPSAFVVLDKFPVTTSGKVDRSRLPAPAEERPELAEAFVRPRTQIEQDLARIWELVLKVKGVGVHDNFFRLGGHSLLATQVISQVNGVLHVEMPLRALFESPTIAEFAQVVEHKGSIGELSVWPTVMKIQPLGTRRPIFFVAAPDINALGYVKLADHLGEDQPLYALQSQKYHKTLTDEYGRPLLEFSQAVVEELASEYVRAMREVQPHGPYSLGGMCRGAHIVFEMATQLKAQGETVSFLGILDTWVMENTYSYLFYVEYYYERARWFLKLSARAKFKFVTDKIGRSLNNVMVRLRLREAHGGAALPPVTAVYWPDSSFVPHIYDGPITVFRVSNQPATRIRSHTLGWEERTTGGVGVEIVPGDHNTVLREPYVQVLASRLNEILAETEARLSNNHPS
jgi:thioesterase domain-containing protein